MPVLTDAELAELELQQEDAQDAAQEKSNLDIADKTQQQIEKNGTTALRENAGGAHGGARQRGREVVQRFSWVQKKWPQAVKELRSSTR